LETDQESGFAKGAYGVCHSELDAMGERKVISKLHLGDYGGVGESTHLYVSAWLKDQEFARLENRHHQIIQTAKWTTYASWALASITFLSVSWQIMDSREQRKQMKEQIEQQRKDSEAQRQDAKELLAVQISVELTKQFDSLEMHRARRTIAKQLIKNSAEIDETRLVDFFEDLAMYTKKGRIDKDIVYQTYSYWIERYWQALTIYINSFRKQEEDISYYANFEELNKEMLAIDAKARGKSVDQVTPSKSEIHSFLLEEATLPQ
jgi:hypothetical protein